MFSPLRSAAKYLLRQSFVGRAFSRVVLARLCGRPIETWPGWVGTCIGIKLPRRTTPHKTPQNQGSANINIIFALLQKTARIDGDIAECGVFQGETLIPTAYYVRQMGWEKKVFGLDSFEGFGEFVRIDIDLSGTHGPQEKVAGF